MPQSQTKNEINEVLNFTERLGGRPMEQSPIKRAIDMLTRSSATWAVIRKEEGGLKEALFPYTVVVDLIPMLIGSTLTAVASSAMMLLIGEPLSGIRFSGHLVSSTLLFCYGLLATLVVAKIVELIAPAFGLRKSWVLATRVLVYGSTPMSAAALINWLPLVGPLVGLGAFLWSFVLVRQGFKIVLEPESVSQTPQSGKDKHQEPVRELASA